MAIMMTKWAPVDYRYALYHSRPFFQLHNLEVLKIRFGDVSLQVCDVMMKDLADSRRIDQHVHDDLNVSPWLRLEYSKLLLI